MLGALGTREMVLLAVPRLGTIDLSFGEAAAAILSIGHASEEPTPSVCANCCDPRGEHDDDGRGSPGTLDRGRVPTGLGL